MPGQCPANQNQDLASIYCFKCLLKGTAASLRHSMAPRHQRVRTRRLGNKQHDPHHFASTTAVDLSRSWRTFPP